MYSVFPAFMARSGMESFQYDSFYFVFKFFGHMSICRAIDPPVLDILFDISGFQSQSGQPYSHFGGGINDICSLIFTPDRSNFSSQLNLLQFAKSFIQSATLV